MLESESMSENINNSEKLSHTWPKNGTERVEICPVCSSKERSKVYDSLTDKVFFCAPGEWELYRCKSCGSGYLDPRPTPETISIAYSNYFTHQYDDISGMGYFRRLLFSLANGYRNKKYGTKLKPSNALGYWLALLLPSQQAILDASMRHLPHPKTGQRLLDVGCGSGKFLMRAKEAGWDVTGVDPDPKAVDAARMRGLDVYRGNIDVVSEMQESFDRITLSHVIEHVHDPIKMLQSCNNLLKPGGWLWIDTPNFISLGFNEYGRNWLHLDPPRHLVLFTPNALKKALEATGFSNIEDEQWRPIYLEAAIASEKIAHGKDPFAKSSVLKYFRIRAWLQEKKARKNSEIRDFICLTARKNA